MSDEKPVDEIVSQEQMAALLAQIGVMIATGQVERSGETVKEDGRRVITYQVKRGTQP